MLFMDSMDISPSQGEPKGIDIDPDTLIPCLFASVTISSNPATLSSGVLLRFDKL